MNQFLHVLVMWFEALVGTEYASKNEAMADYWRSQKGGR